jgi:uncharacterized protein
MNSNQTALPHGAERTPRRSRSSPKLRLTLGPRWLAAALTLAGCASAPPAVTATARTLRAEDPAVAALLARDWAQLDQMSSEALRARLRAGERARAAQQLEAAGPLRAVAATRSFRDPEGEATVSLLDFERGALEVKSVKDPAGALSELRVRSGQVPQRALQIAQQLARGDSATVYARFDAKMRAGLTSSAFAQLVDHLRARFGDFTTNDVTWAAKGSLTVVDVHCGVAPGEFNLKLTFAPGLEQLAGLYITEVSTPTAASSSLPAYADPAAYEERDVKIGSAGRQLPGTLTLPKRTQPSAGIVLVHGSGPQDRDETTFANRPFRDLALGLASRGIAVLRYEKRTYANNRRTLRDPDRITFDEEAVDDALAALRLLLGTSGIDPEQVFIAGHSQGALAATLAAEREPRVRGVISLAGPARPIEDVMLDQAEYLAGLSSDPARAQKLDEFRAQIARIKSDRLASTPSAALPYGVPAAYWLSLRGVSPLERVRALGKPLLILQGERDYQVSMKEFEIWRRELDGSQLATLRTFPELNHLFARGAGPATPAEYRRPGHVDELVITTIADWIAALSASPAVMQSAR